MYVHQVISSKMFIAALLAIVWQCQKPDTAQTSSEKTDNKLWHVHTVKLYRSERSSATTALLILKH